MTAPDSCPRCAPRVAELQEQIAELEARLQFRPCGYTGPGAARCEVTMPDGRITRGILCIAHQVVLGAAPALGVAVPAEENRYNVSLPSGGPRGGNSESEDLAKVR